MKTDIVHILNRGVEKRDIFLDEEDYRRFVYNLYDFNHIEPVGLSYCRRRQDQKADLSAFRKPTNRKEIVNILCWCLLHNHFHVLVQNKRDNGASDFSKRVTSGYTQRFNLKNERSGVLFQGKSKIISIKDNEHFLYIPYYIFANPVKLLEPGWKLDGIKDIDKVIKFLGNYKWSGHQDIIGKKNFPFVINKKAFFEVFDTNEKRFKKDFIEWLGGFKQ